MQWKYQSKQFEISSSLRSYIDEKLMRIEKLVSEPAAEGEVMMRQVHHSNKDRTHVTQLTLIQGDAFLRAEERAATMQAAFDVALDKLERQLKKYLARLKDKKREGLSAKHSKGTAIPQDLKELLRSKRVRLKPMYLNDAIDQLEMLDHDFYLFLNRENHQVNVVYRREDGGYGLLESEDL